MSIFSYGFPLIGMHCSANAFSQGLILFNLNPQNQSAPVHAPAPSSGVFRYVGTPFLPYGIRHHYLVLNIQNRLQKFPAGAGNRMLRLTC